MKVFLGGICNGSTWRNDLIRMLKIDYFNPVVNDWTPECQSEEIRQRESCDFCLYIITSDMKGVYPIAEAVDDSNKRPFKVIFGFLREGFDIFQIKSLEQVEKMIYANGGTIVRSLENAAEFLNPYARIDQPENKV